jgi:DNA-binding response OmpR family regulator
MRPLRIMVVEDYDVLRETICSVLTCLGHEVVGVPMAEDVDDESVGFVCDLYILDINLPGEDGISLTRRLRRSQPDAVIVIISARRGVSDRICGYESGANLYLTKPLSLDELSSVVDGVTRRRAAPEAGEPAITLHPLRMELSGPAGDVRMTQAEIVLLAAFSRAVQQSLEHWQVASHLGQGESVTKENLEVRVGRLRKKLVACGAQPPVIQSIRGVGYRLCVAVRVQSE